jgi:hypothetical protein
MAEILQYDEHTTTGCQPEDFVISLRDGGRRRVGRGGVEIPRVLRGTEPFIFLQHSKA